MTDEQLREQAAEAFIYGFPLVFDLEQVDRLVTVGLGATPATPFNQFGHARALAGPADTFVSINNDTLYSIAQIDLGVGPVALHVPDTAGRYYVLQFVDAWTNNFAYVGHRATGDAVAMAVSEVDAMSPTPRSICAIEYSVSLLTDTNVSAGPASARA